MGRGYPIKLFPTDDPVSPDWMIGRGGDVEQIAKRTSAGMNLVLAAPRRTGKTTVCNAAMERLRAEDHYTAAIDLYRIGGVERLATSLIEQSFATRPAMRRLVHRAAQGGRSVYESFSATMALKLIGTPELAGIDINLLPQLPAAGIEAQIDYALALPQRIAAADGKHLILHIDEFQDVNRIGRSQGNGWDQILKRKMRAEFQRADNVSFLFSGSYEHMMQTLFGSPQEPFFNFGSFYALEDIVAADWAPGLTARYALDGTSIEPAALDTLIEYGQRHPRATMLVAQHAYATALVRETKVIGEDMVHFAYREAVHSEIAKHEAWLDRLRSLGKKNGELVVRVAQAVAAGSAPYAQASDKKAVYRALSALRDAGFIAARADRWVMVDPLFGDFLKS
ncbi:MAG: hypothetical protein ACRDMJ_01510 [Solirubrobacteraceae bacterium]